MKLLQEFFGHIYATECYVELATKAILILLLFPNRYLCEKGVFIMSNLKMSKKNKLHAEHNFRITSVKLSRDYVCFMEKSVKYQTKIFFILLHVIKFINYIRICKFLLVQL